MAESIIPPGAFAAMKAGQPQPTPTQPKADTSAPKTVLRKPEPKAEPEGKAPEDPPKDMTPAEKKIWKLKADGEEFEFDASDDEVVKREIMKARGAQKKFESAAEMKKQAEQFLGMLKSPDSLRKVLEDPRIGIDLKKFAEEYVWEQIQESQLTPEQKVQRDRERKLAEYEARDAKEAEEKQTHAQREKQAQFESSYEAKITKALETGGIPKTHATVSRMADYLYKAVEHGLDLSPEDLVQQVRQDYLNDLGAVLGAADGDQLLALIGDANAEKLRKADLKRLKSPQGNPFPQRSRAREEAKAAPARKQVMGSEWKEDIIKGFLNRG